MAWLRPLRGVPQCGPLQLAPLGSRAPRGGARVREKLLVARSQGLDDAPVPRHRWVIYSP